VEPVKTLRQRIEEIEADNESEVTVHSVSPSWCDPVNLHVYVYTIERGAGEYHLPQL
jgi:hypothetical protein